jgi:hypothetical protein
MKISFDLDDTLICHQQFAKHEKNRIPLFLRLWLKEPLRLGTTFLMKTLVHNNHEIWIYTSSYRRPFLVRMWLYFYGIKVSDVINQKIHDYYIKNKNNYHRPSKNPKMFGIDLHIDDSLGVEIEGNKYGFRVLRIDPNDEEWVGKVLEAVNTVSMDINQNFDSIS